MHTKIGSEMKLLGLQNAQRAKLRRILKAAREKHQVKQVGSSAAADFFLMHAIKARGLS